MSIYTDTTSHYSGGLSLAYKNLNNGLGFQANVSSGGASGFFSRTSASSSKMVAMRKIDTHGGKLVSESSDVLPK